MAPRLILFFLSYLIKISNQKSKFLSYVSMGEIKKGIYNRRHPEYTDYYRIIDAAFEEFERFYPEMFEDTYGYLREEVMTAIYAFLDCGIPENGVARVWCPDCGDDYFVAYSCRKRGICVSCSTKRSLLFGEKIQEIAKPIAHIHITFTIPKILRAYFRRNRGLLKYLVQAANYAVSEYYKEALGDEDGLLGGIYYVHSRSNLALVHCQGRNFPRIKAGHQSGSL